MRHWLIIFVGIIAFFGLLGYVAWRLWPDVTSLANDTGLVNIPTSGPVTRFAVVGDNHGVNDIYRSILRDISSAGLPLILNVADNSEYGTVEEFEQVRELEESFSTPVLHVLGSHDVKTDPTGELFVSAFGRQPCSSFDHGHVRIIILDNAERKIGFPAACLAWLETELARSADRPVILAYHRPFGYPLSDLIGDDETAASRSTNDEFLRIIANYPNIIQIFGAHLHTYLPYRLQGIPAVITGGGGDPAQTVLGGARNNNFHWLEVTVRGAVVTIEEHPVQITE